MQQAAWTPEAIRQLRLRLGLTQQDMAVQLHAAVRTIAAWERGQMRPSRHFVHALSEMAKGAPEQEQNS